jgi:hypothetical protein
MIAVIVEKGADIDGRGYQRRASQIADALTQGEVEHVVFAGKKVFRPVRAAISLFRCMPLSAVWAQLFIDFSPPAGAFPLYVTARIVPYDCNYFAVDFVDATSKSFEIRANAATSRGRRWFWRTEARALRKWESRLARLAKLALAVTRRDALILGPDCLVVPLSVRQYSENTLRCSERPHFLFFGTFGYEPNDEAACWLSDQYEKFSKIGQLEIFGKAPTKTIERMPAYKGSFESLDVVAKSNSVLLAPILSGAGVQSKVIESAALGLRCLVTPLVSEGLEQPLPTGISVATRDGFVCAATTLVEQDWDPDALKRWASKHYGPDVVRDRWLFVLDGILS